MIVQYTRRRLSTACCCTNLNAPLAEGCRLRGVLRAPGAVRIAVQAGDGEDGTTFLYEIPNDTVAPYYIPGILRTVLAGTQLHSSSDISEAMGMTVIRLRPAELTPDPEPEHGRALTVLRALSSPDGEENPVLIGFLLVGHNLLRLYVQRTDHPGIIGVDTRLTGTPQVTPPANTSPCAPMHSFVHGIRRREGSWARPRQAGRCSDWAARSTAQVEFPGSEQESGYVPLLSASAECGEASRGEA
ncbi:hypothetical protein [Streptomyces scabiei]|uniref:hypothetical protein n=1 Tax=Streptomyces scabiei TaxID=1930 RepID=UPI001B31BDC5|nr:MULTISPECIES: hypothetical protein [Streptomyces]MBP5895528.1 hypothetical protein [Streptomyces sp. LBUM 1481]MBP5925829.1 hypothetical protein [Streptomyces sp. LBUM 1483]MDX2684393.1 hypothetical protein [Streptomyces scabiei]MDX2750340.1 hypothetical protein [Streptomyces scabiei]MDX2805302.1 hypothetical protein [Streptomyces scabiei]